MYSDTLADFNFLGVRLNVFLPPHQSQPPTMKLCRCSGHVGSVSSKSVFSYFEIVYTDGAGVYIQLRNL